MSNCRKTLSIPSGHLHEFVFVEHHVPHNQSCLISRRLYIYLRENISVSTGNHAPPSAHYNDGYERPLENRSDPRHYRSIACVDDVTQ